MKAVVLCIIGLLGIHAGAESLVEGRVRLPSGAPVPGAQVLLLDLTDQRAAPIAATTDRSGNFTLPLAALAGVLPERFELGANYPNPFNPSTMIPYQLPAAMRVRLEVFNILGQQVATLVDGEQPAGFHTATWDATDAAGQAVGAGVYLYRLSGGGMQLTRSMLLIDGQAGIRSGGGGSTGREGGETGATGSVYGLAVSGPGLVPYVDPAFRVEAGMAPLDLVVEAPGGDPSAKAASSDPILGDVDNTGRVDFFDALLVALYSLDASVVMPNNGDISLGDVDADGSVDLSDAWAIAAYLNDPADPALPSGIGEPVAPAASLSPDPSTVAFIDDGAWHRFTVQAGEPVSVVANPEGTPRRLEITTRSGRGNFCPAEAGDDVSRRDGQRVYLAGCSGGSATVELRRASDGTVLQTYTFEVTGSPADLVVSASVSDSSLTPGQSFTLHATVRNQGTAAATATTLSYYRSTNRTISTQDTLVGTDAVSALGATLTSAESITLTAPSSEGAYYYGACVASIGGESAGNNCSGAVSVTVRSSEGGGSVSGDRNALVALYHATDGDYWSFRTNWLSNQPLGEWYGVTTDANGRVRGLQLYAIRTNSGELVGIGSDGGHEGNGLSGVIPPALGNLSNLETLDLHGNQLTGSIPVELGNLSNLETLYLESNQLTGSIPVELGNLSNLKGLGFYANDLTGGIPAELGNLSNLQGLDLGGNQLTGTIPAELANLSNLRSLQLAYNSGLSGPLPGTFTGLSNLKYLDLGATGVCAPTDKAFQAWLRRLATKIVVNCTGS